MEDHLIGREEYIQRVLSAYRQTPGIAGVRLAASRRLFRPTEAPPLGTIRSLAYFVPVLDEVLELTVSQDYFRYLRSQIASFRSDASKPPTSR